MEIACEHKDLKLKFYQRQIIKTGFKFYQLIHYLKEELN